MTEATQEKPMQQRLEGTIDIATEPVRQKAQVYVDLLYSRMKTQEGENVAREELIELMQEHDIVEFELDGYEVKLKHTEKDKVTVKKTESAEE